jgi:hypothetical protein
MVLLICSLALYSMEKQSDENFCFKCIILIAAIALFMAIVGALRPSGENNRLRDMQGDRRRTITVRPLAYHLEDRASEGTGR